MSTDDVLGWSELLTVMAHGPDLPVHGTIRHVEPGDEDRHVAWSGFVPPAIARGGGDHYVAWRDGARVRIETSDGLATLVTDGRTAWHFPEPGGPAHERPEAAVLWGVDGTDLHERRGPDHSRETDFAHPTGPVTTTSHLGRRAWAVELAPPSHKPYPLQMVVDAETGLLLQLRVDGAGVLTEWTELVVGEPLAEELFVWDGPSVSWAEQEAEHDREREAHRREQERQVRDELGRTTLRVSVEVPIVIHEVDDDGSLRASMPPVGDLTRRPRSEAPWDGLDDAAHRWSDERWDWALESWGDRLHLDDVSVADLRRQLTDPSSDDGAAID